MRLPLGLRDIQPRALIIGGILSVLVFALTIVPDPLVFIQLLSGLAAIGSFVLAYLNQSRSDDGEPLQEAAATGDGPNRVIQIMDSTVELSYPDTGEASTIVEGEPEEEVNRD